MSFVLSLILFLLFPYTEAKTSEGNNDTNIYESCQPTNCSINGPKIRSPFRLETQPLYCGLEGFELSCSNNKTVLHLPSSGDYYVQAISYLNRTISIMDVHETARSLQKILSFNLTNSKFSFIPYYSLNYTIVNCTKKVARTDNDYFRAVGPIDCMSDEKFLVYITFADDPLYYLPSSCRTSQTFEFSSSCRTPQTFECIYETNLQDVIIGRATLEWKALGDIKQKHGLGPLSIALVSIGTSIGGIILFALVIFLIYKSRESEKEKETQLMVEKFLEDYRTVNPTRYTYRELKKITSRFKHRLGQGGYGSVYKGKLFNGIPVAVKMLEHIKGNGQEFINEVATIGRIHHFHVVRLLGFCSEGTRRALIYEFMPKGSLEKFIFSKMSNSTHRPLSWEKLRKIAIGVARGMEYLHQGCNQRILHFDIKPHNILLDHNFQPKISDFGLAKLCSKDISIVSLTAARGTAGYIAPELFSRNFGDISYKSDVYSYGMMLLEMVGCRKNTIPAIENQSQIYFPEWIYNKMLQGQGLCLEFEEDGDDRIAKKLAMVALWCIQWNPTVRPSMPMVLQMLEGDLQSLEIPPMPFVSDDVEASAIS